MSIKRLFDVVERRGDIGRRIAALVLPISNRPRVTSRGAGKIRLREPGEHTSGPNLASRDNVAHNRNLYTILETPPRLTLFIESRPGHRLSDGHMLSGGQPFRPPSMSALPPKADIANLARNVRFVPKADSCNAAKYEVYSIPSSACRR
jgi:hypothetical protein